jgi:hypothetical protein
MKLSKLRVPLSTVFFMAVMTIFRAKALAGAPIRDKAMHGIGDDGSG